MVELTELETAQDAWGYEDDPDLYVVAGFDMGGTSGWSLLGVHPDAMLGHPEIRILNNILFWTAGQYTGSEDEQCDEVVELLSAWPSARLVLESFFPRKASMDFAMFSPMRMNAVLQWALRPRYFVAQQPSLAMTTITDDRQKAMGMWIPGQEHARDATKHVLTFLKRQRERNAKAAAAAAAGVTAANGG